MEPTIDRPLDREERYGAAIAGLIKYLPEKPFRRMELYWDYIAKHITANFAGFYDEATTYRPGDITVYQGDTYKAKTNTTGEFNPAKWDRFTIDDFYAEMISRLRLKADLVDGKVPPEQLPSYVSEMVTVPTYADLPEEGEANVIYITKDDGKSFRWNGSGYFEINDRNTYYSVPVNVTTMGQFRNYIDGVNQQGLHVFLDMHNVITDGYICTAHFYTAAGVNHCAIHDVLNAKFIQDPAGYSDSTTVADYCNQHIHQTITDDQYETWTFKLADNTTVTKKVVVVE